MDGDDAHDLDYICTYRIVHIIQRFGSLATSTFSYVMHNGEGTVVHRIIARVLDQHGKSTHCPYVLWRGVSQFLISNVDVRDLDYICNHRDVHIIQHF